jgi:hypothetical protein
VAVDNARFAFFDRNDTDTEGIEEPLRKGAAATDPEPHGDASHTVDEDDSDGLSKYGRRNRSRGV